MDFILKGWFTELSPDQQHLIAKTTTNSDIEALTEDSLWGGQAFSIEVEEVLYHKRSKFQDILVFKSKTYGNVLVLDGVIQCTERDEFSYQEMISHVALFSHPEPKKVLIIGGGDGGVMRECLKHSSVESVIQCEIDKDVMDVSQKYLKSLAVAFQDPRVTVHVGDGFEYMKNHTEEFDVIITDSSDPIGPAASLFQSSYYELLKTALRDGGIVASQATTNSDIEALTEDSLWGGQAFSIEVEEVLYHKRSKFQDILVFKSKTYGNILVLDGVIQCTERDEFSYQEMISHVALFSHPEPKNVLIIGGGDGGVMRECLKHSSVESVIQCEIDKDVMDVSQKYLKSLAVAFQDPRVTVHVGDGFEYMKNHTEEFDVIITDSSDPIGPAASLFQSSYYELLKTALRDGGIVASQAESIWLHLKLINEMHSFCRSLYPSVAYCQSTIPSYPSGTIGYMLCSKTANVNFPVPLRTITQSEVDSMKLRYYNSDVHRASFVLPEFARKALESPEESNARKRERSE